MVNDTLTVYAKWVKSFYAICGTVTSTGTFPGTTVKLIQGSAVLDTVNTNDGVFSFSNIAEGIYSIVVENGDRGTSLSVAVTDNMSGMSVTLPAACIKMAIEVKENMHDASVEGLIALENDYAPAFGDKAKIVINIESKDETNAAADEMTAIETLAGSATVEYLNMDIDHLVHNAAYTLTNSDKIMIPVQMFRLSPLFLICSWRHFNSSVATFSKSSM